MDVFRTVEEIRKLPDLKPQEKELLEKAKAGDWLILGDGKLPSAGDETRSIRAGIIRYLLLGGCEGLRCHERGVQIMGAWVPDRLDLVGCDSGNALAILSSRFSETPIMLGAKLRAVALDGSNCLGINAEGLRLRESINLSGGFCARGGVWLRGAQIGGDLDCTDGTFSDEGGIAMNADDIKVGGSTFLQGRFSATGEVRLLGAEIGGTLSCIGGSFDNAGSKALSADRMKVVGSVFLRDKFNANGEVRLPGAEVGGNIDCADRTFWNEGGNALHADGVNVNGAVFLRGKFSFHCFGANPPSSRRERFSAKNRFMILSFKNKSRPKGDTALIFEG